MRDAPVPGAPPSVLHLGLETPATRPSGLNAYLRDLHAALRASGVSSTALVAGARGGPPEPSGYVVAATPNDPLPLRLWRLWRTWATLPRPDVVDSHFALHGLLPVLAARAARRPIAVHFHGPWADESRAAGHSAPRSGAKGALEAAVYRRADACVVLSDAFGDLLTSRYGVSPWAVRRLPPGVDLGRFRPPAGRAERHEIRASLGLEPGAWVALAVRRLMPRMGLDVLLDAWDRLAEPPGRPLRLVIVGDGPERGALEDRVRRRGRAGSVRLLGRIDEATLVRCYQAADFSVVPSVALEGFGLVVLESLACGTPAIGTAVGGLPEVLGPLGEDLVVAPGDPAALARRLGGAFDGSAPLPDPASCRSYAERFSWSEVAARHVELYSSLVTRRRPEYTARARPLRVLVVGHTAQLSGGELAMARLLPALRDTEVTVLLGERGPLVDVLRQRGIHTEVLDMPGQIGHVRKDTVRWRSGILADVGRSLVYVNRLRRRLRQLRPDLVHTNTLKAALYGGLASRLARIPCIWHVRDRIDSDYLPPPAVRLVRLAARLLPTEVVANSRATLGTLGLASGRGTVVPSPVDVGEAGNVGDVGGASGGPPGDVMERPLRIGILGRISPWKGQDVFLRAFAEAFLPGVAEAAKPVEAVVIGSPLFGEEEFERQLHRLAKELRIEERVDFRGFRRDVGAELGRLDVLVHASTVPEPFGQVVVEGMALGLPVVAAAGGGPSEIVRDGVDGLLYPPGDARELSRVLRHLATSAGERRRLGDAARTSAQRYRPEAVALQVQAVYERVA